MTECHTITASRASIYPALAPRKTVTETDRLEFDVSNDFDCSNAGVMLTATSWAIHPDDDDATLILGVPFNVGMVAYQPYSGGTVGQSYRITLTASTDDGQGPLEFTAQVSIVETMKVAYG